MYRTIILLAIFTVSPLLADDYFSANREMIKRGVQAVLTCNGLFTSNRSLEQVFEQELAYMGPHLGDADGGDYRVYGALQAVEVGTPDNPPVMRAAFREGIGCVVLAPDQALDAIPELPEIRVPDPAHDPESLPWPRGDLLGVRPLPAHVDPKALAAASDWAFDRESDEQRTLSLLVIHNGQVVHERYAPGVDRHTRTRTWSTAKSIAVTLIGILVDRGQLAVDEPLGIDWLPELRSPQSDPRGAITLRHVLNMSSGLYPVDSFGMEYATGSGLAYWAGADSVDGARSRGLVRAPGTFWDYENYDTLLAVYAMKRALGSTAAYHRFPHDALLGKIGMHHTLLSTDRFGNFILSSQVYTNARDLARFGLLYLNGGRWLGEQIVSEKWIDFVRTPAPASSVRGNDYGAQWWLVPDERDDVPREAYSTAGNRGQYVIVVPSHDTVIVRRGLDYGRQGFDRWDLTREVLKAIEPR
ncbi:MAG: serine hydrolase [Xanthomonadales bacterium]|nr:beta-lactamase family protein [Gammaproteobacteria bacterium]MBT8051512.1 beta-lactamase family protein [Gammaproteobacteria bacterium]MBT8055867.1 beta-lactamase family protein [Gammaproteobacteria bacterium]NNJ78754.1 serine hydrolase [Xanthomonadales bacterium]NNL05123.1 serine hydrolase [Xanthomonadales bacterium]